MVSLEPPVFRNTAVFAVTSSLHSPVFIRAARSLNGEARLCADPKRTAPIDSTIGSFMGPWLRQPPVGLNDAPRCQPNPPLPQRSWAMLDGSRLMAEEPEAAIVASA